MSIEISLEAIAVAMAEGFETLGNMDQVIQDSINVLDARIATLDARIAGLNTRMTIFEGQMTEVLGRLRIIGEQLATHTHEEEAGAS